MNYILNLIKPLETMGGTITSFLFVVGSFLLAGRDMFIACIGLVCLDALFGVWSSVKRGKFFESHRLRETIVKMLVYLGLQIATLALDKILMKETIFFLRVSTALICVCEIWSILASVMIISPNLPLGRLLKKWLAGEIAKKIDVSAEEVEKALDKKPRKKKGE